MLQFGDFEWQLAQFERQRLIVAWRAAASPAENRDTGAPRRWLWRWRPARRDGIELTPYVRSEWMRPLARAGRIPHATSTEGASLVGWSATRMPL
ncbi:MAG: hypothetical protein M3439_08575 [Chloroflexota bacterium]|nr:hypothetical protein [Chloroflexota bacterium]